MGSVDILVLLSPCRKKEKEFEENGGRATHHPKNIQSKGVAPPLSRCVAWSLSGKKRRKPTKGCVRTTQFVLWGRWGKMRPRFPRGEIVIPCSLSPRAKREGGGVKDGVERLRSGRPLPHHVAFPLFAREEGWARPQKKEAPPWGWRLPLCWRCVLARKGERCLVKDVAVRLKFHYRLGR